MIKITDKSEFKIKSATKKGYEVAKPGDSIRYTHMNSKTRKGRVGKKVAQSLDTASNQVTIEKDFVRRLTPIECERLQGFPDNWTRYGDFDGEQRNIDTQRYKQCGNAVTVDNESVFSKLYPQTK